MLRWERGTVVTILPAWSGVVRCEVELEDGERVPALAYPELTGAPSPGEVVLLNTNALRRGLGTGGQAFVVARPDAVAASSALSSQSSVVLPANTYTAPASSPPASSPGALAMMSM